MVIGAGTEIIARNSDIDTGDARLFEGFIEQCDAIADLASPPP